MVVVQPFLNAVLVKNMAARQPVHDRIGFESGQTDPAIHSLFVEPFAPEMDRFELRSEELDKGRIWNLLRSEICIRYIADAEYL